MFAHETDAVSSRYLHHVPASDSSELLRPLSNDRAPGSDDNDTIDISGSQKVVRDNARHLRLAGARRRIDDEAVTGAVAGKIGDGLAAGGLLPITELHHLVAFAKVAVGAECLPIEKSGRAATAEGNSMVGVESAGQGISALSAFSAAPHRQDQPLAEREKAPQWLTQYSVSLMSPTGSASGGTRRAILFTRASTVE